MNKNKNKIKYIQTAAIALLIVTSFAVKALASDITPSNVLTAINQERVMRGLPILSANTDLNNAATLKAKDMVNRHYFEHYAFGLAPWDFMRNQSYDYIYAGENLAMDFSTTEGMVKAWMNSPSHKENILNKDFREIGIGTVKGVYSEEENKSHSTIMVSTMYGTQKPKILKIFDAIVKFIIPGR